MSRYALLIGNSEYDDERLMRLKAPISDIRALAELLRDPEIGKFNEQAVNVVSNPSFLVARKAIVEFFSGKKPDDLLVFYFSGHGVVDWNNCLYLAVKDTRLDNPRAEGIDSPFIKREMGYCVAKQQVLLLDCCFSGAFTEGIKSVGVGAQVLTENTFVNEGEGQVVLTASANAQYAWDGDEVLGDAQNSLFTSFIIEGLKTGAADYNNDGLVTPDDLYGYVYEQVVAANPSQKPQYRGSRQGGITLAYNPNVKSGKLLPVDVLKACNPGQTLITRLGAVIALQKYLQDNNPDVAQAARSQLEMLALDDSRSVSSEASRILQEDQNRLEIERKHQLQRERAVQRREREKQARLEAEQKAAAEAAQRQRLEEERKRKEAEDRARLEAEQKAAAEAAQRQRLEEERKRKEAEDRTRLEAEQKAAAEAAQRQRLEEERRQKEAGDKARLEAELKAAAEAAERQRLESEQMQQVQKLRDEEKLQSAGTSLSPGIDSREFYKPRKRRLFPTLGAVLALITLIIISTWAWQNSKDGVFAWFVQAPGPAIVYHKSFQDNQALKHELWRVSLAGGKPVRLSETGWHAAVSPDDKQIAYGQFYNDGIWVMNADGKRQVQLNTYGDSPAWSPDGKQLAYNIGTAGAEGSLWVMNADGTGARQVNSVPGSNPDWSPDGSLILFHGEVNSGIWQVAPDGSGQYMLYRNGGYPAWSPDGEQIAYVKLHDWTLWVMNKNGTGSRKLTDHAAMHPAWSADGQWIAYQRAEQTQDGKSQVNIWIINLDGSGNRKVVEDGLYPDWIK